MKCVRHICYNVTNNQNSKALAHTHTHMCMHTNTHVMPNAQQIDFSFDFEYNMSVHGVQAACFGVWVCTLQTSPPLLLLLVVVQHSPGFQNSHQNICTMLPACNAFNFRSIFNLYNTNREYFEMHITHGKIAARIIAYTADASNEMKLAPPYLA